MRWETERSFDGKFSHKYSYEKLSKSDNWFSSYSKKCRECFLEAQCICKFALASQIITCQAVFAKIEEFSLRKRACFCAIQKPLI